MAIVGSLSNSGDIADPYDPVVSLNRQVIFEFGLIFPSSLFFSFPDGIIDEAPTFSALACSVFSSRRWWWCISDARVLWV